MQKPKRKRNIAVTVRMNADEYADFRNKVDESGLTQQSYVIDAVLGAKVTTADEVEELKKISAIFADQERQLRGLGTNVNQMAHVANGQGFLPAHNTLNDISGQISL